MERAALQKRIGFFFLASVSGIVFWIYPFILLAQGDTGYPHKPIEFVVNYGAGSSADRTARIIADPVSKILGQPLIINNKTGGSGVVGALYAAKSKPDGYTIYLSNIALFGTFYAMSKNLPYKISDFDHICRVTTFPCIFVVNAAAPWNSIADLVDYIKKNPGKITYGSPSVGTTGHFTAELFKLDTGLDIPHVPFKEGMEAATAVLGDHVKMAILNEVHVSALIKAGKLKPLAVTSSQRLLSLPNVPTMVELGYPRCVIMAYFGVSSPAGLPKPVAQKLVNAFNKAIHEMQVMKTLERLCLYPDYLGPEEYGKFILEDLKKYTEIVQKANIIMK